MKYQMSKQAYRFIVVILVLSSFLSHHFFNQRYQKLSDENIENIKSKYDAWDYNQVLQNHIQTKDKRIKELEKQLEEQPK